MATKPPEPADTLRQEIEKAMREALARTVDTPNEGANMNIAALRVAVSVCEAMVRQTSDDLHAEMERKVNLLLSDRTRAEKRAEAAEKERDETRENIRKIDDLRMQEIKELSEALAEYREKFEHAAACKRRRDLCPICAPAPEVER